MLGMYKYIKIMNVTVGVPGISHLMKAYSVF